jgi:opacity protein-like surface antigen
MRIRPLVACAVLAVLALPALAANPNAKGETDLGLGGFFSLTQSATGNDVTHTTPNWYGGTAEVRHISSPLLGFEVAYSIEGPHNDAWSTSVPLSPPGFPCTPTCSFTPPPTTIQTFDQTFSLDWVPSMRVGNLRPFAVLGIGALLATPDNGQVTVNIPAHNGGGIVENYFSLSSIVTAAYVYGAGVDWRVLRHAGIRLQYRGEMYKDPDVTSSLYPATGAFVQTAEPTIGIYFGL